MSKEFNYTKLLKLTNSGVDKEIKQLGFKNSKHFKDVTGININEIYGTWIPRTQGTSMTDEEFVKKGFAKRKIGPVFTMYDNRVFLKDVSAYIKKNVAYIHFDEFF